MENTGKQHQIGVGLTFVLYAENKGTSQLGANVSVTRFLLQPIISRTQDTSHLRPSHGRRLLLVVGRSVAFVP